LDNFVFVILIIFAASFTQGFSGFGFALVSIPLLSLVVDIKYAIPLGALCGLVVNIVLAVKLKDHIKYFELKNIIMGSVIGIPIGVFVLSYADQYLLKMILGIFVLIFVIITVTEVIKPKNISSKWGYLAGLLSGLFGGAFNTNGPPVLIYFYLRGWDKLKFKGQITGFFIITSTIIVISHFAAGITTTKIFIDFLYLLPAVLIGIFLGTKLFNKVSTEIFNKIVMFFLFAVAIYLIV
jgi:uncharacterized membrane protein YfcA